MDPRERHPRVPTLEVHVRVSPQMLDRWTVAEGFRGLAGDGEPRRILGMLRWWAADPRAWVNVATTLGKRIVGYIVLGPPRTGSRWNRAGQRVLEVVFLEVAGPYRRRHVLDAIAREIVARRELDDRILFARLLPAYWDRRRNRLRVWAYRRLLIRFAARSGFRRLPTNDPAIALNPFGAAIVRLGSRVPPEEAKEFRRVAREGWAAGLRWAG